MNNYSFDGGLNPVTKSESGSATLEAVILVQLVFWAVFILTGIIIYYSILANTRSIAGIAAVSYSSAWTNQGSGADPGDSPGYGNGNENQGRNEGNLYWRFLGNTVSNGLSAIEKRTGVTLNDREILPGDNCLYKVNASLKNLLTGKIIVIEIVRPVPLPLDRYFAGLMRSPLMEVQTQVLVFDNAEFIRNVDFISDTAAGISESLGKVINDISEKTGK